uniref:PBP1A family penicillin-binding protein n=1 Tax=candidate division WOR-3 bacterium TaxID=2052148 RepID=A0A7V3UZV0_UNCW3
MAAHRLRTSVIIILVLVALAMLFLILGYLRLRTDLPTPETIINFKAPASTRILDCQGRVVSEFFQERRRPVPLETIPEYLIRSIVAVEDKRFYSHWGIDLIRVAGSIVANLLHPRNLQGASTITQQLARSMFLTPKRQLSRKLKEMVLAIELERHYSKQEILEMYLNQVWFGGSIYGVAAAAERYFGKHISRLDPIECATLGAMIANPSAYSPYKHPQRLLRRRNYFLGKMYRLGLLTREEYNRLLTQPLNVLPPGAATNEAPYFVEEIRRYLINTYGYDFVYKSGATIYTTVDLDIQTAANRALLTWLDQLEQDYRLQPRKIAYDSVFKNDSTDSPPAYLQGALVVEDVSTGEIRALIGGRDFQHSEFNRATQSLRQVGSAFKPFVYAAALDNGYTAADIENDSALVIRIPGQPDYRPHNYDQKFLGRMTLRRALALSRNIVAVRLCEKIGPDVVARYANLLGITHKIPPFYSIALGSIDLTLLEMTNAFNTIANQGVRLNPYLITKIEDAQGHILEEHHPDPRLAIRPQTAYILTSMMQSVVNEGTATTIRALGFTGPAAGKTGTTDDYTDAWFIGFTPTLTCGVWIGYDRKKTIFRGATGGVIAAPVWGELMKQIYTDTISTFPVPPDIITQPICEQSGKLATPFCPRARYEVFIKGTEPVTFCPLHVH